MSTIHVSVDDNGEFAYNDLAAAPENALAQAAS
jgi:hypothetical protein